MRRTLAALLALTFCLALCACGASAPAPTPEPTPNLGELLYNKYATIIDALEAEDYDGAVEAVEALRPAPKVTEVEITMDNLWDYFEIVEKRNEKTDAQGNMTYLYISNCLALKADYLLADVEEYPMDIAVGFEYDKDVKVYQQPCTLDFENYTCDASANSHENNHMSEMAHFPSRVTLDNIQVNYQDSTVAIIVTSENFEILNASGTLYLVNK